MNVPTFRHFLLLSLMLAASGVGTACAQQQQPDEYDVKAVYLYHFFNYVEWPSGIAADRLTIGLLGDDPFGNSIDRISRAKKSRGREVAVRRFRSLQEYEPCHILFVPKTVKAEQQTAAIEKLRDKNVLLVGEVPGFATRGGTVNFFVRDGTVRFEINMQAAKHQQLIIGAKLQNLARTEEGH